MDTDANRPRVRMCHIEYMPVLASALVILGAKLLLIKQFGANVPFWDQWDAEAAYLYKPYLEGCLRWVDLFAPHNEHRILFTRISALGLLELNGLWAPKLQMVANAILHTAILGLLLAWLTRGLRPGSRLLICLLTAAVYAVPFGWANTLAGFQSQFYFVFGFSIAALWSFTAGGPFSVRWFFGLAFAVAAYFSMASGALTLVAIVALLCLQIAAGARAAKPRELLSVLALSVVAIAMLAAVTHHPGHDSLTADGLGEFIAAFARVAGWPARFEVLGAIILNLPIVVLLVDSVLKGRRLDDPAWAVIAVALWLGTQWISIAYGRADSPTASRYLDTLSIGIVINSAAALLLLRQSWRVSSRLWLVVGLPMFATIVVTTAAPRALNGAALRHENYLRHTANLSAFLKSDDIPHITKTPRTEIPYPDPKRLALVASDPSVRKILHPTLTGANPPTLSLPTWLTASARAWQRALLRHGYVILFLGFVAFGCSVFGFSRASAAPTGN